MLKYNYINNKKWRSTIKILFSFIIYIIFNRNIQSMEQDRLGKYVGPDGTLYEGRIRKSKEAKSMVEFFDLQGNKISTLLPEKDVFAKLRNPDLKEGQIVLLHNISKNTSKPYKFEKKDASGRNVFSSKYYDGKTKVEDKLILTDEELNNHRMFAPSAQKDKTYYNVFNINYFDGLYKYNVNNSCIELDENELHKSHVNYLCTNYPTIEGEKAELYSFGESLGFEGFTNATFRYNCIGQEHCQDVAKIFPSLPASEKSRDGTPEPFLQEYNSIKFIEEKAKLNPSLNDVVLPTKKVLNCEIDGKQHKVIIREYWRDKIKKVEADGMEIANVLSTLHKNKIFHGDAHINNFVKRNGKIKAIDLSYYKDTQMLTRDILTDWSRFYTDFGYIEKVRTSIIHHIEELYKQGILSKINDTQLTCMKEKFVNPLHKENISGPLGLFNLFNKECSLNLLN